MKLIQMNVTRMAMVAICSAALIAPLSVLAQDTPPPPPPPAAGGHGMHGDPAARDAKLLDMMTQQLTLTDAQQASIKQIFADSETKMKAAHDSAGSDPEAMHKAMEPIMKDRQAAVRAVLTPDQQTKYDAMAAQMHHGGPGGGHHGQGGGDGAAPPPQQ